MTLRETKQEYTHSPKGDPVQQGPGPLGGLVSFHSRTVGRTNVVIQIDTMFENIGDITYSRGMRNFLCRRAKMFTPATTNLSFNGSQ